MKDTVKIIVFYVLRVFHKCQFLLILQASLAVVHFKHAVIVSSS